MNLVFWGSLNYRTLYFFRYRIVYSAHVMLSLSHCIAPLDVFTLEKFYSPTVPMSRDIVFVDKVWSL